MKKLFICFLVAYGSSAFAWGPIGQEAVAQIAFLNLTPSAASKVKQILGNDEFAESANWADQIKQAREWKHTATYHYTSVEDDSSYFETLASSPSTKQNQGDVVLAIAKSLIILRDAKASVTNKKYALKFLIHFVGDIHQPLHVGRSADKGGNAITVNWYGKNLNLHWLWDGAIIETAFADKLEAVPAGQQSLWLANYLLAKNSRANRYEGKLDIEDWINGSFALRPLVYDGYDASNDSYMNATLPHAESQMLKAGLNLAATLNTVFANTSALSISEREVINLLNKSLERDFRSLVNLEPAFGR